MMYRRSSHLVAYWEGACLQFRSYAAQSPIVLQPSEVEVLAAMTSWQSVRELRVRFRGFSRRRLSTLLARLVAGGIAESSDRPPSRTERALTTWADWSPAGAFLHFDTKNAQYADPTATAKILAAREALEPVPSPLKSVSGRRIPLPTFQRRGIFPSILLSRRSWRRFSARALTLQEVSTLLGLTWATQEWVHVGANIMLALKTSPSGGACHSLEVYVAARNVEGLARGVYHYCPDSHTLVRLKQKWSSRWVRRCLAGQTWTSNAAAVMFMTSVFPRVQWKYRSSRAYRTVLLEAGHFCQTFCLTATWLGLAPFCTASLAESVIEPGLAVDGVTESVVYVAGVGARPDGVSWAPYPETRACPRVTLPVHRGGTARPGRTAAG